MIEWIEDVSNAKSIRSISVGSAGNPATLACRVHATSQSLKVGRWKGVSGCDAIAREEEEGESVDLLETMKSMSVSNGMCYESTDFASCLRRQNGRNNVTESSLS